MSKNKVFVFGGAGFLGKAFCRAFPQAVVCDSRERLAKAKIHGVEFDFGVDRPEGLPCGEGDLAVIFSWRGYPASHDADPVGKLALNLRCTLELVSWLATRRVGGIFYASTGGAVYGNIEYQPVNELVPTSPVGFYGIGKATAEMYVRKVCRESGVRHMIFRIGNAYGIDQIRDKLSVGFIAEVVNCAMTGKILNIYGDGSISRDYIHAADVASAIVATIQSSEMPSGVYNLGSDKAHSNSEVVQIVERVVGRAVNVVFLPMRPFDVQEICLDCSALRKAIDWRQKYSIQDGIREMVQALGGGL